MADFSDVSVAETAPGTLAVSGVAHVQQDQPVVMTLAIKAVLDSTTRTYTVNGTETVTVDSDAVIESVTDDKGGTYVIAPDGHSAQRA